MRSSWNTHGSVLCALVGVDIFDNICLRVYLKLEARILSWPRLGICASQLTAKHQGAEAKNQNARNRLWQTTAHISLHQSYS